MHTRKNTFLTVKSETHVYHSWAYLLNGSEGGNGLGLPAALMGKEDSCSTVSTFLINTPNLLSEARGLEYHHRSSSYTTHDGKDIMLLLMSTFGTNILGYRTIHASGMKINLKKISKPTNKNFKESFSYPLPLLVIALYEVKDFGVCEYPKQLCWRQLHFHSRNKLYSRVHM